MTPTPDQRQSSGNDPQSWSQRTVARIVEGATHPGMYIAVACGFVSAVFYTLSNIALRQSVSVDSFFVAAMRSSPTVLFLTPYLLTIKLSGRPIAASRHLFPRLVLVSLVGQIGGNGSFQLALGHIGLAASVPITLGAILIGSAFIGRWLLGETVQRRTMLAIAILIGAVVLLSQSGQSSVQDATANSSQHLWLGTTYAVFAGLCYALFSSTLRLSMKQGLQSATGMWISGAVGTTALFSIVALRTGFDGITQLPSSLWLSMLMAGLCNFIAFVAITTAMRVLPIVAVHLLNASQVAMAATAGVIIFSEPLTKSLVVGILLTMVGLLVLATRKSPKRRIEQTHPSQRDA